MPNAAIAVIFISFALRVRFSIDVLHSCLFHIDFDCLFMPVPVCIFIAEYHNSKLFHCHNDGNEHDTPDHVFPGIIAAGSTSHHFRKNGKTRGRIMNIREELQKAGPGSDGLYFNPVDVVPDIGSMPS